MFDQRLTKAARSSRLAKAVAVTLALLTLGACASLGASGPETSKVRGAANKTVGSANIQIVPVTDQVARQVLAASRSVLFSETLGNDVPAEGTVIGRGDILQVSIWEAPPAVLFGAASTFGSDLGGANALAGALAQQHSIPDMMVDDEGMIQIPFAGSIRASGRSPRQVEREIAGRLAGKAHDPQVAVRIARNASSNVTLVGDVASNSQIALTPKGERLLDALASAGGVKTPIDKTTIQITRDGRVVSLPLETVIRDPAQNIRLQANDVITAISQSYSFTALGETGASAEVPFESTGITLAQALGRAGGLKSDRADPAGVFIFRLEDPAAVDPATSASARRTPDGRIPVIYVVDLKKPASFFVAQSFPVRDKDVLYVSRAPLSDLQRFVGIVASMTFPIINVARTIP
jgi:polysaccharide export outer membrane protein